MIFTGDSNSPLHPWSGKAERKEGKWVSGNCFAKVSVGALYWGILLLNHDTIATEFFLVALAFEKKFWEYFFRICLWSIFEPEIYIISKIWIKHSAIYVYHAEFHRVVSQKLQDRLLHQWHCGRYCLCFLAK